MFVPLSPYGNFIVTISLYMPKYALSVGGDQIIGWFVCTKFS